MQKKKTLGPQRSKRGPCNGPSQGRCAPQKTSETQGPCPGLEGFCISAPIVCRIYKILCQIKKTPTDSAYLHLQLGTNLQKTEKWVERKMTSDICQRATRCRGLASGWRRKPEIFILPRRNSTTIAFADIISKLASWSVVCTMHTFNPLRT